MGGVDRKKDIV